MMDDDKGRLQQQVLNYERELGRFLDGGPLAEPEVNLLIVLFRGEAKAVGERV